MQIGRRVGAAHLRGPRPFAAFGCLIGGWSTGLVDVNLLRMTVVAVFDDTDDEGRIITRVVGSGAALDEIGLRYGGLSLSQFDKDLRLPPLLRAHGRRLNLANTELLSFALQLEKFLERASRHRHWPRRRVPRLPTLSGFYRGRPIVTLAQMPKRQLVRLDRPSRDLVGRIGTTRFDFYHTRFCWTD